MRILLAIILVVTLTACATANSSKGNVPSLRLEVLATLPHDRGSFTEGLEISGETLYESTGLEDRSFVHAGPVGRPPTISTDSLPSPMFGEGITVLGPTMWQLTWKDGIAIERDTATLAELRRVRYEGEGWGLCHEQGRLVMSNGTDRLTFRDPASFAELGEVTVHSVNKTYSQLNELECVDGNVYANVWQTDYILRIDPATGVVTGLIDASGLLTAEQQQGADVLNGIAAIPGTDEFLITGKLWPVTFRARFLPAS